MSSFSFRALPMLRPLHWALLLLSLYALAYGLGAWLGGGGPAPLPTSALHGSHYADTRSWLGIANAADTLSNLPFALLGLWGMWTARRAELAQALRECLLLVALGLLFTALGSSIYHLAPSAWTLVLDRAGMAVAFTGLLALATADRLDAELARGALRLLLPLALLAAALPALSGNLLPWALVQFGGMAWVLAMALRRPLPGAPALPWVWLLVGYALAKLCEGLDAGLFAATGEWISGHTLKHLVAALALVPLLRRLSRPASGALL